MGKVVGNTEWMRERGRTKCKEKGTRNTTEREWGKVGGNTEWKMRERRILTVRLFTSALTNSQIHATIANVISIHPT